MDWTEETSILFVERLKHHPCLWNTFHEDKKNRVKIVEAYKTLAEELDSNIATVRKRKENIFQTYRNYKRKVARSRLTATCEEEVYQPSWTLYPYLDAFLHPVYTPKGPVGSYKEEKRLDLSELPTFSDVDQQPDDDDDFVELNHLESEAHSTGPPPIKQRKAEKINDTPYETLVLKQVVEINKRILSKISTRSDTTPTRDECSLYGDLTAIRLRKLDEAQRQFAMYEIDNILYNITLGLSFSKVESTVCPSPYIIEPKSSPAEPISPESSKINMENHVDNNVQE